MTKERLSYLGRALNGEDIPDSLKRLGVDLVGFMGSYKLLVELSKPTGHLPAEYAPLIAIPLVFFAELNRQGIFVLGNKVEKKLRTYLRHRFPRLGPIIRE